MQDAKGALWPVATMRQIDITRDELVHEIVARAKAESEALAKLLVQYVVLFRPATRQLSLDRLAALLGELLPLIEAGRIERGGRIWAAPLDAWKAALEDMIAKRDKLTLPLKSHGYLLEVIAGQAGKAEAAAETRKQNTAPCCPATSAQTTA